MQGEPYLLNFHCKLLLAHAYSAEYVITCLTLQHPVLKLPLDATVCFRSYHLALNFER
jgi:hypothetical protein